MTSLKKSKILSILNIYKCIIKDIYTFSKIYLFFKFIQIIINAIYPLTIVIFPKLIIDSVVGQNYFNAGIIVITLLIINILYCVINQLLTLFFELKNQQLSRGFEKTLLSKLMDMDYRLVELAGTYQLKEEASRGSGYILSLIDKTQVLISSFITLLSLTYMIVYLNIFIALLILIVIIVNGYVNYKKDKVDIKMDKDFAALYRKWGYLNYICRDVKNAQEIRLHHLSNWLSKKISNFCEDNEKLIRDSLHNSSLARRYAAISSMVQKGVVYFYIGFQLWKRVITAGEFTQYISAFEMISSTLISVVNSYLDINKDRSLIQNYYQFKQLHGQGQREQGTLKPDETAAYQIEIKDVWFRYNKESEFVLKGLSLTIMKGECLSIVGRNGCGKTTLVKLLLRLFQPERGQILLNGRSIYEYDYNDYFELFSIIFQDFKIFSFTVLDNILMSDMPDDKTNVIEEEGGFKARVDIAIEKAELSSLIDKLPKGVYTYINRNYVLDGIELSGGNQQKLAMSRAYYRNARNIFLDEPTAMLDAVTESRIYENFNRLIGDKTAIYISHRMSSSRFCDKIAYIEDGVVKEYGSHEQLMELNKLYANMFKKQAKLFTEK